VVKGLEITKQLLLNLSLFLVLIFFFQIFNEKRRSLDIQKWAILLFCTIALIISLSLSIKIGVDARFDLRSIPLIIGSLYSGMGISFFLFSITLVLRALFGINYGLLVTFIVFGIQTFICIGLHKWFLNQTTRKKISCCMLLSILNSGIWILIMMINDESITSVQLWFSLIVIPAIGTLIFTYIIEALRKNFILRERIILSEKIQVISTMAASISHEVRNPLTSIRGFLQLMKNSNFEEEKRKEFIEISISELNRAEKIINEYLSYSRPAVKQVVLLDVNLQINQLTSILEPLSNMNSVVIEKNLYSTAKIIGDISEFQQSFLNIMKNCIEAMPNGGTLSINTMDKNDQVQIVIADTGIGMTDEQIQKLGEPYFTTKGSKGTGLGMMVTFNIIKSMYGKIIIKSIVGKGTTFIIHFPTAKFTQKSFYYQSANVYIH
jgi:two-component system sporulation sensor kinase B